MALHPVYERQAERLTAKARKYGITVPQQPTRYDEDSDDWYLSHVFGFWLPSRELEQRLRREIRDERRASYEEFLKRATLLFVKLLGTNTSLAFQRRDTVALIVRCLFGKDILMSSRLKTKTPLIPLLGRIYHA